MNNNFDKFMQFTDGLMHAFVCSVGLGLALSSFGLFTSIVGIIVGGLFALYCNKEKLKKGSYHD